MPSARNRTFRFLVILFWPLWLVGCQDDDGQTSRATYKADDLVLALSWQPAFCEGARDKPECRSQHAGRFDASHFALHGLWPQPRGEAWCGVGETARNASRKGRWRQLARLSLAADTRQELEKAMPGTASFLHRHEWVKHGTCYSDTPETYYRDTLALQKTVNASAVRDLFVENIGRRITARSIRRAFSRSFGDGAGRSVRVKCRRDGDRQLIVEITIGLKGRVEEVPDMARLLRDAPPTDPGCPGGVVDPVGYQ